MSWPAVEAFRFYVIKNLYSRLLSGISFPAGCHLCELGAGTGSISRFLGDKFNASVTLVDNNPSALNFIKKTFQEFPNKWSIVAKDVFDLGELECSFDLAHSGGLIEHFTGPSRKRIIKTHTDLVKKSGYLIIFVPIKNTWYHFLNEGIFKFFRLLEEIPEEPWTLTELSAALNQNGFKILRHTQTLTQLGVLAQRG